MKTRYIVKSTVPPHTANKLTNLALKTKQSKASVIRSLIDGAKLREFPPADYQSLLRELHAIGNNLNQIALVANATNQIDKTAYLHYVSALEREIYIIKKAVSPL